MKLKIAWYNVLRGFHKKELNGTFTFEKKRLDAAKKIISNLKPDILFIGEGDFNPRCKIKGPKIKQIDYQKIFKYPYVYYSKPDKTSRTGEVFLSKFPLKSKNFSKGNETYIRNWINVSGKKINIDMVHPYPTISEKEKARWIGEILNKKETPYVLLGDFNAFSPGDKYKLSELVKEFTAFQGSKEKAKKNAKDALKYLMVKKVISKKLIDTYKNFNKKFEGTLPTKKYAVDKAGKIRIDYIFCSKDFKVLKSGIIKNKLTEMASDHYPIYAVLELK